MENLIAVFISLCILMLMSFWIGYRLGFNNGLAIWRKDYSKMTHKDVMHHMRIIKEMAAPWEP